MRVAEFRLCTGGLDQVGYAVGQKMTARYTFNRYGSVDDLMMADGWFYGCGPSISNIEF